LVITHLVRNQTAIRVLVRTGEVKKLEILQTPMIHLRENYDGGLSDLW
jgi:hypothetical protein